MIKGKKKKKINLNKFLKKEMHKHFDTVLTDDYIFLLILLILPNIQRLQAIINGRNKYVSF